MPTYNPINIPNGTLFSKDANESPSKDTPAFAKANSGIIPKATYGLIACSIFINKEEGAGMFEQIHSNHPNEFRNYRWKDMIIRGTTNLIDF